jgi:hypothetical protein
MKRRAANRARASASPHYSNMRARVRQSSRCRRAHAVVHIEGSGPPTRLTFCVNLIAVCVVLTLIMVLACGGCVHRTAVPTTTLPADPSLDWYAQKAIAWFDAQRTVYSTFHIGADGLAASIDGEDFDRGLPIKKRLSPDRSSVTVYLPRKIMGYHEEWFFIRLDARTGKVIDSGPCLVHRD